MEKIIESHGKKIEEHDIKIENLSKEVTIIKNDLRDSLIRVEVKVEEQNKFVREQNNTILNAVLNRNEKSDTQKHELEKKSLEQSHEIRVINFTNLWKVVILSAGAGGIVTLIVQAIIN